MSKASKLPLTSERNSESNLPFASRQHLCYRAERLGYYIFTILDRPWILTVQQIEELEQQLYLDTIGDVETLGKAHIEINECRGGKGIPPGGKIDAVEITVAVRVSIERVETAEVKTALRPKDAADLKLPRKIHEPVDLKNMIQGQARRAFIQIRAIYKGSRLCNKIAVSAYERSVRVRLRCTAGIRGWARFNNYRSHPDELIRP